MICKLSVFLCLGLCDHFMIYGIILWSVWYYVTCSILIIGLILERSIIHCGYDTVYSIFFAISARSFSLWNGLSYGLAWYILGMFWPNGGGLSVDSHWICGYLALPPPHGLAWTVQYGMASDGSTELAGRFDRLDGFGQESMRWGKLNTRRLLNEDHNLNLTHNVTHTLIMKVRWIDWFIREIQLRDHLQANKVAFP